MIKEQWLTFNYIRDNTDDQKNTNVKWIKIYL